MDLKMRVDSFIQLGKIFDYIGDSKPWDGHHLGVNEIEFQELENTVFKAKIHNGWFDEENVRLAFKHLSFMLNESDVIHWAKSYNLNNDVNPKTIAIIMAGNIPMVGFHDLLCVLVSGHRALVKLSSDDNVLLPVVVGVLGCLNPELKNRVTFVNGKMEGFDAVIATGSDNSARYFEAYFGKQPYIIRKNRTSVAVLNGKETEEQLEALAEDVFMFYGLGCRNISKVFIPEGYDKDKLFKAFFKYKGVVNNNKYANNYDYNKAVYLMGQADLIENGFLLLKEDTALNSPLSVLFYESYQGGASLQLKLDELKESLQCTVSANNDNFGISQKPQIDDYADGVDVVTFLSKLP